MSTTDPERHDVAALLKAGRYEEALHLLGQLFDEAESEPAPSRTRYFMTMFEWKLLLEEHPPAQAPLRARRDAQVERLLAGAEYCGTAPGGGDAEYDYHRASRFSLIYEMNGLLRDECSTYETFSQLDATQPVQARRYAHMALPAVVAMQDFALAERYCGDPLDLLHNVNVGAHELPLFPPPWEAPRLAADLSNLVKAVRIGIAVLRGRGKDAEADRLREAMLDGLEAAELKDLARRELDQPGTITREVVAHQMAEEDRRRAL